MAAATASAGAAAELLRPRSRVPAPERVDAGWYFSADELRRVRRFRRGQRRIGLAAAAVDTAVLAGAVRLARRTPADGVRHPVAAAAAAGTALSAALTVAGLPTGALARRRALDAGLATGTWRAWARDAALAGGISAGMSGAATGAGIAAMRRWPRGWWLAGGAGVAATGALLLVGGPVVLDPLFNRFDPLEGPQRDDVVELAARGGVRVDTVLTADASRRTTAANAYVTGLGATKRVVLFDTLLDSFTPEETRLVIAHELAHVRHRDVVRGLAYSALAAPAALLAAGEVARMLSGGRPPGPATVPALAVGLGLAGAPAAVLGSRLSRAMEVRADAFALDLAGEPDAFVGFERRITLQNLADPAPPRWRQTLFGSHPTTVERIGLARAYGATTQPQVPPGR